MWINLSAYSLSCLLPPSKDFISMEARTVFITFPLLWLLHKPSISEKRFLLVHSFGRFQSTAIRKVASVCGKGSLMVLQRRKQRARVELEARQ